MKQVMSPIIDPHFKPDIHIIIKVNSTTGQTFIESGNGRPLNPLVIASICSSVAKANIDNTIQQQSMLIGNNRTVIKDHKFEPTINNPIICQKCGLQDRDVIHQGNYDTTNTTDTSKGIS